MSVFPQWSIKYRPKKFTDLRFASDVHVQVLRWFKNNSNKILNINGPCGTGKTSLAHLAAKAMNYFSMEIGPEHLENISEIAKGESKILKKGKAVLIIDESIIRGTNVLKIVKNNKIPIIFTTNEMFLKRFETFKVFKPNHQTILDIVKPILIKEGRNILDQEIASVSEQCDFDIRMTLNSLQMHRSSSSIDFSKAVSGNHIFYACKNIITRYLTADELEQNYSPTVLDTCLNFAVSNSSSIDKISEIYNSISDADVMSQKTQFCSLMKMRNISKDYSYIRSTPLEINVNDEKVKSRHYFKSLKNSSQAASHLQCILKRINPQYLNEDELNLLNAKLHKIVLTEKKVFRYKFKKTAATSIRKDLTLKRIFDL